MDFPGFDGFLPFRGSFMLDVVFLAMFAVVPALAYSIYLVRYRRAYALHRRIQLALGAVLLITVLAFEADMRLHGWRLRAEPSPFYPGLTNPVLAVHLAFAVSTALLWVVVIARALKRFPFPPRPGEHSPAHRLWGRLAAAGMFLTAATGWLFYYLAFIAS